MPTQASFTHNSLAYVTNNLARTEIVSRFSDADPGDSAQSITIKSLPRGGSKATFSRLYSIDDAGSDGFYFIAAETAAEEGKAHAILLYANTAPAYRAKVAEVAAKGYEGFVVE